MRRKITDIMYKWKMNSAGHTALMIDGARRVGKSYITEDFAKTNYKSYILIDFARAGKDVKELFDNGLNDLDEFFLYLSEYFGVKLYEGESLIILDEVQRYPRAREAIKFLVADGRYHYIETGSLLSIRENVADIQIPSEERHIKMYPMDFEEFLWAMGEESLMDLVRAAFESGKPLGSALHRKIMSLFRQYIIVGGMPQAVNEYVDSANFEAVDSIKRDILELYKEDIQKHAGRIATRVKAVFDEIPEQLSRHEQRFNLASLEKGARYRDYEDAFFWLSDAMLINNCYNTREPNIGLKMNRDRVTLKCYFIDTGLLISHAFDENGIVSEEIYKKILFDKLSVNLGMIYENVIAQMLVCSGHKLFFYSNSSRKDASARMEIDFLLAKSKITNKHNISPIEVKSGDRYTLSSIRKFCNKYKDELHIPYVLHTGDISNKDGLTFLPLYMAALL